VDGEKHVGGLDGEEVVFEAGGEEEEVAGVEVVGDAVGGDADMAVKDVDGDVAFCAVRLEAGLGVEDKEGDGLGGVLVKGFLAVGGIAGAGFAEEGVGFGGEVEGGLRGCEADVGVGAGAVVGGLIGGGGGHGELLG
jgi:hypothetical protein